MATTGHRSLASRLGAALLSIRTLAVLLVIALLPTGVAQDPPEPWTAREVLDPAVLAAAIQSGKPPLIISVVFPVLYRSRHITGALEAGAAAKPEGIETLKKLVANLAKNEEIVIYCGCCPMVKCPNIRPAYRALKEMGFTKIRVLDIPTNMTTDWYAKNYPSEKGLAANGASTR